MKKTIFSTLVLLFLCIASYAQNATNRAIATLPFVKFAMTSAVRL